MALLDEETKKAIKDYLSKMRDVVELVVVIDRNSKNCMYCDEIKQLFVELDELKIPKLKIKLIEKYDDNVKVSYDISPDQVPIILIRNPNIKAYIAYRGIPADHEFGLFLETILEVSTGHVHLSEDQINKVKNIKESVKIDVYVTPSCPYCPAAVASAYMLAMINPNIKAYAVEATEFPEESNRYRIRAVPTVVINNGQNRFEGALPIDRFIAKIEETLSKK
ncbi:MAG: thioredoxin family protein [Candidatus Micrarchaeota archaeon]|nr:thioredoxin family protein [Candidatus Micrarchaeota archaeon]